jgi:integrase
MPQPLTQAKVNAATTTTRALIADGGCRGLYLDVRPNGKSYRLRYTEKSGQQRTANIGDASLLKLSDARKLAQDLGRRLLLGEDIQAKPEAPAPEAPKMTFGEFVRDRYIPHARVTKRGFRAEMSILKNHILPAFEHRPLAEVTKAEIVSFIHQKIPSGLGSGTINRLLNALKAIFSRAIEWEIAGLEKNPAHGVKQLPNNHRHERFLSQDEAASLLAAVTRSANKMLAPIVAFLLLTGCRKREVLDARWEHIDLERGQMTVPLSKSGKPRYVVLSAGAKAVLGQTRQILRQEMGSSAEACPWVFPNPATGEPFVGIYTSWDTARRAAGLQDVRVHDLRHSFASALVNRGATLFDVQKLLGHSSPKMTERYSHLTPGRLTDAATEAQHHYAIPELLLPSGSVRRL